MEKQSVQRGALIKRKNGTDLYETLKRDTHEILSTFRPLQKRTEKETKQKQRLSIDYAKKTFTFKTPFFLSFFLSEEEEEEDHQRVLCVLLLVLFSRRRHKAR